MPAKMMHMTGGACAKPMIANHMHAESIAPKHT